MPELPDITIYIEALESRLLNQRLEKIRLGNPFLLRSFEPPIRAAEGKKIVGFERIGKRIVFQLEDELFLVFHLDDHRQVSLEEARHCRAAQVRPCGLRLSRWRPCS